VPLVIDANRATDFCPPSTDLTKFILRFLLKDGGVLVVGGKLLTELARTPFRNILVELDRSGLLKKLNAYAIDVEVAGLNSSEIKSNDQHVIAIMRLADCRLIFTEDRELIADIKNSRVMQPKGKVIQSTTRVEISRRLLLGLGK
jgi:hypothetical protein